MRLNRKCGRIFLLPVLLALFMAFMTGCGAEEAAGNDNKDETVKIPMILTVDSATGNRHEEELVQGFNMQYEGKYEIEVEWIMETEEEYRQNLKRMNVTDELPAIITDVRLLPSFYRMMIEDERIEDLSSYIMGDEQWLGMIEDAVLESYREEDGSIYLAPIGTAAFSCSGMFWNERLFKKAGIDSFPTTWEEFWDCCDKLEKEGIVPLALHTEGTGWAPMLIATANLADTEEGLEFMKQLYPESYSNKSGITLAKTLKRLFKYTTEDALYNDFDVSHSHFFSGEAAMIPNGYWMLDQIPEDMKDYIRFSPFPGNKLISSPETFGWALVSGYSDEVRKGAVEFFKFRTRANYEEREKLFSMDSSLLSKAENDYITAYKKGPQIVPNYQVKWNSILQESTLGECLPLLAAGKMTPEEFTAKADESIEQFESEK